jgi:hypothetical protein
MSAVVKYCLHSVNIVSCYKGMFVGLRKKNECAAVKYCPRSVNIVLHYVGIFDPKHTRSRLLIIQTSFIVHETC